METTTCAPGLAFIVTNASDNSEVHFGADEAGAWVSYRSEHGCEHACMPDTCECITLGDDIVRAPEFDRYAGGPIPLGAFLSAGWRWICTNCQDDPTDEWGIHNGKPYCLECLEHERKGMHADGD